MVTMVLKHPTTDGDTRIRPLTNSSSRQARGGGVVAEVYRRRWRLESTFPEVTRRVPCESNAMGYPPAAWRTFSLA